VQSENLKEKQGKIERVSMTLDLFWFMLRLILINVINNQVGLISYEK